MINLSKCEYHFSYPQGIAREASHLKQYPNNEKLRKALSQRHSVKKNQVVISQGAIELLKELLLQARNKNLLLPEFTWQEYSRLASEREVNLLVFSAHEREDSICYDTNDIIKKSKNADLVLIPSPNNPTGYALDESQLKKLLRSISKPVVIDAAYHGFSNRPINYGKIVKEHPNTAVILSFSKYFGMPGLRCGYAVLGKQFKKAFPLKDPYLSGLNHAAQKLAIFALSKEKDFARSAAKICYLRKWFSEQLKQHGMPFAGESNFVLVKTTAKRQAKYLKACARAGICIKRISHKGKAYLRIDIAPKSVLLKVLSAMGESR